MAVWPLGRSLLDRIAVSEAVPSRHYAYPEDLAVALAFGSCRIGSRQQPAEPEPNVDKIVVQEQAEVSRFANTRLSRNYIQKLRPDKDLGAVPDGDKYFLGRAELAKAWSSNR